MNRLPKGWLLSSQERLLEDELGLRRATGEPMYPRDVVVVTRDLRGKTLPQNRFERTR